MSGVISRPTNDAGTRSARRVPILIGIGVAAVAVGAAVVVSSGLPFGSASPESALRAAAVDYNNAMIGKVPAKNLLTYAQASCTAEQKDALTSAPALARAFAPGVTGFEITKVTVAGTKGTVYVKATGPGAAAINNITDTGGSAVPADKWVLTKGQWFRADC
jgi:hypothetical protein